MKRFSTVLAATALLASTSTAALAQADIDVDAGASGGVGVETDSNNGVGVGVEASGNAKAMSNANENAGGDGEGAGDASADGEAQAGVDAGGDADAEDEGDEDAAMSGASDTNYGSIISSLRTGSVTAADIEALGAEAEVDVVTVSEIQGSAAENASALEQAMGDQETSLDDLRAALEANAEVSAALQADGVSSDDIVAVASSGEGNLTLVVDDSE